MKTIWEDSKTLNKDGAEIKGETTLLYNTVIIILVLEKLVYF